MNSSAVTVMARQRRLPLLRSLNQAVQELAAIDHRGGLDRNSRQRRRSFSEAWSRWTNVEQAG
jgi:hypothetical protein